MVDGIKTFFITIGVFTVGFMFYIVACEIINKFNRWRNNGCKIKCLCKPYKYKLVWYWRNTEEAVLECKKCGKRKQVFIDYDSIRKYIRRIGK